MSQHLLKLSHRGYGFHTTLLPGGRVRERPVTDPSQEWFGHWTRRDPKLTVEVGRFTLEVPAASGDGPWWGEERTPDGDPVEFTVARADLVDASMGRRWGLAKVFGDGRIYLAELSPDKRLREYPLEQGALQDPWAGEWDLTSKGLEIRVGDYNWCGHPDPELTGLYRGDETGPEGTSAFNCVTYRLRDSETTSTFQIPRVSPIALAAAELLGASLKGLIS